VGRYVVALHWHGKCAWDHVADDVHLLHVHGVVAVCVAEERDGGIPSWYRQNRVSTGVLLHCITRGHGAEEWGEDRRNRGVIRQTQAVRQREQHSEQSKQNEEHHGKEAGKQDNQERR
jgi:hypothetical protein